MRVIFEIYWIQYRDSKKEQILSEKTDKTSYNYTSLIKLKDQIQHWTQYDDRYYYRVESNGVILYAGTANEIIDQIDGKTPVRYSLEEWTPQYLEKENKEMPATQVIDYVVLLHAEPKKDNSGNDITEDSKIIVSGRVVAKDIKHVERIAMLQKEIQSLSSDEIGRLEVKAKTF